MPGILYHLTFAEEVYKSLGKKLKIDKIDFMAGNLIPDLAIDKKKSHYRTKAICCTRTRNSKERIICKRRFY